MLPKLTNCIQALKDGVSRVHILDGRIAHCLLLEIFTNRGIGTAITSDHSRRNIMNKKTENIIEKGEQYLLHTYNRYPLALDHGDGVYLYDTEGKKYLDFFAGIAVFALGYNNKEFKVQVKAQVDKIVHISNYFYSEPTVEARRSW